MTTNVYRSRSRTTRTRLLLAAAVVALVMLGFGIGRLAGDDPPAEATTTTSPSPSPSPDTSPAAPTSLSAAPPPSSTPPSLSAPAGAVDAYQRIEVESAAEVSGLDFEDTGDEGGGKNAGWINTGDYLRFDNINFGAEPPTQLNVRIASEAPDEVGGRLEIRLDSPTAPAVATLSTSNTGGWQNWRTQATPTNGPATGVHTVFVTFGSNRPDDFLNVNWLTFRR